MPNGNSTTRIVREKEREAITGVPTSSWYEKQARGEAPKPVPLGPAARGWMLDELLDWIERRRAELDRVAS